MLRIRFIYFLSISLCVSPLYAVDPPMDKGKERMVPPRSYRAIAHSDSDDSTDRIIEMVSEKNDSIPFEPVLLPAPPVTCWGRFWHPLKRFYSADPAFWARQLSRDPELTPTFQTIFEGIPKGERHKTLRGLWRLSQGRLNGQEIVDVLGDFQRLPYESRRYDVEFFLDAIDTRLDSMAQAPGPSQDNKRYTAIRYVLNHKAQEAAEQRHRVNEIMQKMPYATPFGGVSASGIR